MTTRIVGTGSYVPEQIVTNDDLAKIVETNDEWITTRTGIKRRHRLSQEENASDLGTHAARKALEDAGLDAAKLTHILTATCTPDHLSPSLSCIIGGNIGAGPAIAIASYVTGRIANKAANPGYKRLLTANFIGLGIVYLFGMVYYYLISNFYLGTPIGLWPLFLYCFILVVPGDIVLCILGAILGKRLIPIMNRM